VRLIFAGQCVYIYTRNRGLPVSKPTLETNRNRVAGRLKREGWVERHGGSHDVYKHPAKPGIITLPRHNTFSPGVARTIAKAAGWIK